MLLSQTHIRHQLDGLPEQTTQATPPLATDWDHHVIAISPNIFIPLKKYTNTYLHTTHSILSICELRNVCSKRVIMCPYGPTQCLCKLRRANYTDECFSFAFQIFPPWKKHVRRRSYCASCTDDNMCSSGLPNKWLNLSSAA